MTHEDFLSHLAEGFHTAFRKATDAPGAHEIWTLIRALPPQAWGDVIAFVADGITQDGKHTVIEAKR